MTEMKQLAKRVKELEEENAELKETLKTYNGCGDWDNDFHTCRVYLQHEELQMYIDQLTKAKEIMNIAIEGIKHWGIVGGTERPFEKQAELEFNLFLEKAEQFLKDENIILEDAQAGNSPFDADEVFNKEIKAYPEGKVK